MVNFNKNIKYLIDKGNFSYRSLSKKTDISAQVLFKIGSNQMKLVSLQTALKLSEYFKISVEDLVYKDLSRQESET